MWDEDDGLRFLSELGGCGVDGEMVEAYGMGGWGLGERDEEASDLAIGKMGVGRKRCDFSFFSLQGARRTRLCPRREGAGAKFLFPFGKQI
jgi:hypothetical protein